MYRVVVHTYEHKKYRRWDFSDFFNNNLGFNLGLVRQCGSNTLYFVNSYLNTFVEEETFLIKFKKLVNV